MVPLKSPMGSRGKRGQAYVEQFAKRLRNCKSLKDGSIVLRLSGPGGGEYWLQCSAGEVRLAEGPTAGPLLIQLIGNARRIQAVLEGKKDAVTQFLAGGFRVRGDPYYISDLFLELGILKKPLWVR